MKRLVIAEKPSVGMSIASVLGARDRKDGYIEGYQLEFQKVVSSYLLLLLLLVRS